MRGGRGCGLGWGEAKCARVVAFKARLGGRFNSARVDIVDLENDAVGKRERRMEKEMRGERGV